jgi:hypothetical protein
MEFFYWNLEKNELLKKERGICFEDIILRIHTGHVLAVMEHPKKEKYSNQMIMIINVDEYAYMVPFVPHEKGFLLKTIIPSRKYTKKYLRRA